MRVGAGLKKKENAAPTRRIPAGPCGIPVLYIVFPMGTQGNLFYRGRTRNPFRYRDMGTFRIWG